MYVPSPRVEHIRRNDTEACSVLVDFTFHVRGELHKAGVAGRGNGGDLFEC